MTLNRNGRILLRDGRYLAFREYGLHGGFPVIFTHGNLNSQLFEPCWDSTQAVTAQAGIRLLAVDRPGYGDSSYHEARTYTSWAHDVKDLADALDLTRFAVLGFSSGGVNALACAAHEGTLFTADRLVCCGLIASDGPYWLMDGATRRKMFGQESPVAMDVALERSAATERDLRATYMSMGNPDRRATALADLDHAIKQGLPGAAHDGFLESRDWQLPLSRIRIPVLLWHGDQDTTVPVAAAVAIKDQIPQGLAALDVLPGENHSLLRRHWGSILRQVASASSTAARL